MSNISLSGTIMEPEVEVVGYGKLEGRGFTWSWCRRSRSRAYICVTAEDAGNLFNEYEDLAIRRAIVRLWKGGGEGEHEEAFVKRVARAIGMARYKRGKDGVYVSVSETELARAAISEMRRKV